MKREVKLNPFAKVLVGVIAVFVFSLISNVVLGAAFLHGLTGASVAVSGTVTEAIAHANVSTLNLEDISEDITKVLPGNTPIDTILRSVRKTEKLTGVRKRYYSVSSKPLSDVPAASAQGTGAGTVGNAAITYTYASGNGLLEMYIKTATTTTFRKHDTLLMRDLLTNASGIVSTSTLTTKIDVMFYVVEKTSDVIRIVPINGIKGLSGNAALYVMPNFTSATPLYRMGNAMNEVAMQAEAWSNLPTADEQICQNFMAQVEESTFQKLTTKEVAIGINDFEDQNIYDLKNMIEMSKIFGAFSETTNLVDGDVHYTTKGIINMITQADTWTIASGVTQDNYLSWMRKVFVGSNGSTEKWLFAGDGLIASLHKVDSIQRQVDGRNPVTKLGLTFSQITTFFGTLNIIHAPLFSINGWSNNGLIIDPMYVFNHNFIPMNITTLDLKSSGVKNAEARVIQEVGCATLTNPKCHLIIKGV